MGRLFYNIQIMRFFFFLSLFVIVSCSTYHHTPDVTEADFEAPCDVTVLQDQSLDSIPPSSGEKEVYLSTPLNRHDYCSQLETVRQIKLDACERNAEVVIIFVENYPEDSRDCYFAQVRFYEGDEADFILNQVEDNPEVMLHYSYAKIVERTDAQYKASSAGEGWALLISVLVGIGALTYALSTGF